MSTPQTTFVQKASKKHNGKYGYELVNYNEKSKVKIVCPEHGVFESTPSNHLNSGCNKCFQTRRVKTTETYVAQCQKIHEFKYDYSEVLYKTSTQKVKIICFDHGVFEMTASSHLNGNICPECSKFLRKQKANKNNLTAFLKNCEKLHGSKYTYEKVVYAGSKTLVTITCPKHGDFSQRPNNHLSGAGGCKTCFQQQQSWNRVQSYKKRPEFANAPGILYVLKFKHTELENVEFVKVGITSKTIKSRYKRGYDDFVFEILLELKMTNLQTAVLEREIFNTMKPNYKFPKRVKFKGCTECFEINTFDIFAVLKLNETLDFKRKKCEMLEVVKTP